jgi:YesN/AraC family two-component response regulator
MFITATYLEKQYDDLLREQQDLLTSLKNLKQSDETIKQERNLQKQISIITQLLTQTLKLKSLKKEIF